MKEWYLITQNTRPNITGGFENELFVDYKEDGFFEALNTDLASDVVLYMLVNIYILKIAIG